MYYRFGCYRRHVRYTNHEKTRFQIPEVSNTGVAILRVKKLQILQILFIKFFKDGIMSPIPAILAVIENTSILNVWYKQHVAYNQYV